MTEKDLKIKELEQENRRLKYAVDYYKDRYFAEESEVVRLRRQIEFLLGHDNV